MNNWIKPSTEQILEVKKVVWGKKNGKSARFSLATKKLWDSRQDTNFPGLVFSTGKKG